MPSAGYVAIADQRLIYVLIDTAADFDKIARPVSDTGPKPDGSHVITKSVEQGDCTIIFQYWIKQPITPALERAAKQRADALSA